MDSQRPTGSDVVHVKHKEFYEMYQKDKNILSKLVFEIAKVLSLLQSKNIVHFNLTPQALILELNQENGIDSCKISDFTYSTFWTEEDFDINFSELSYMPPEILEYSKADKSEQNGLKKSMVKSAENFSIDSWSLGVILLEIVQGTQVKKSLSCQLYPVGLSEKFGVGVFSSFDNNPEEILNSQREFITKFSTNILMVDCYSITKDKNFKNLI